MGQLGYGKMGGIDGWDWSFWFELVVKLGCGVAKECRNLDVCIKQRLKRHGKRWGGEEGVALLNSTHMEVKHNHCCFSMMMKGKGIPSLSWEIFYFILFYFSFQYFFWIFSPQSANLKWVKYG